MERMIPRRDVLAFIAVHGTDAVAPHTVRFEEYVDAGVQWRVVALVVEDEAAVRFWAAVFGHHPDRLQRTDHPAGSGGPARPHTLIDSMADGWWGLTTDITATIDHSQQPAASLADLTAGLPLVMVEAA